MSHKAELTPEERELESALRSLRPTPARLDPVAAERLAPRGRSRWWQSAAAAAVIIAAGGAWLALNPSEPAPLRMEREIAVTDSPQPPTLLVYRRALAESPAALDAMLDRHALTRPTVSDRHTPVRALRLWNPDLPSSLGEM